MNKTLSVGIQVASAAAGIPTRKSIRSWVRAAVKQFGDADAVEVSVRIVDEEEGRQLNREFRDKDRATNVLSFPPGDASLPPETPKSLGDIVICAPLVECEAAAQGKATADHWAHLLVHGTLHLLGCDHDGEQDAAVMEALETRILAARGVANPYSSVTRCHN